LALRSGNENFDAIGKAKNLFCACAIAQRRIEGAENAQAVGGGQRLLQFGPILREHHPVAQLPIGRFGFDFAKQA